MDRPASMVRLPPGVRRPFTVYVNGVRQAPGTDFEVRDGALLFGRPLAKEGRLGMWRWLIGAFGIGTYAANDTVDVAWEVDGAPRVAHALDVRPCPQRPAGDGRARGAG